ncbi:thiamine-phosphate kinase [Gluconobacter kanchanaburiensis]|uniref:Thiamine-monophosphate kinase n=1 Tax=Gluconobacter kanchanaburiensis NBRC 103587 TaxID=1307948 RepID=A0A511BCA3_9PROT|nr:thiamine-phosphate kinase [Gluconobacter kanchanaburiensis]MBF0861293.1 thiamine-phosphate kinase [Gluconobacter kanchanaburiensis]GBR71036.1 thiamine monophosphate kinase [Gluconobacter kanchanaburiensis NBRC 103587]GEK97243.1 thiamine-monophosphate kinase [Gluconobacter kanchanaburiensis NBRC 103587]
MTARGVTGTGEFDFIARYFRPLAGSGSLDLRDDCALMRCPDGKEFAISTDTMVENVHFLPDDPAETLGCKLLRCNLSDLAAMGARPHAYTLNVTVPRNGRYDEHWFSGFSRGLAADQRDYGIHLLGGDTTSITGPLVISATVFGLLDRGSALRRNGAAPGDEIWVTGTIGDGALGLLALQGKISDPSGFLAERYRLPRPRTGLALHGIVSAAMDISDGLIQDCGHIAHESGVQLLIEAQTVPTSDAAAALGPDFLMQRLSGGDDYELLLTCAPQQAKTLQAVCQKAGVPIRRIGTVRSGSGVKILDAAGCEIISETRGWQHF